MSHGHVRPSADGSRTRCGGPGICAVCNIEAAADWPKLRAERDAARILFNKEYNEANESRRRLRAEIEQLRAELDAALKLLKNTRMIMKIARINNDWLLCSNAEQIIDRYFVVGYDAALKEGGK